MARRSCIMFALAVTLIAALPRGGSASIDLNSSVGAGCVDAECLLVKFVLSVPDQGSYVDMIISRIGLFSSDATQFAFGAVQRIWNTSTILYDPTATNNQWTWGPNAGSGLYVENSSNGYYANQPISILVSRSGGPMTALPYSVMTYDANGYVNGTPTAANQFSTAGQVTPEPVSIILLGTGLAGVAGARRRRKAKIGDDVV